MKRTTSLVMFIGILICTGCSKKKEEPVPQQPATAAEVAPQAHPGSSEGTTPPDTAQDADNKGSEPAAGQQTDNTVRIHCGAYDYDAKKYKDWICLNGVLRCLKKDGCRYEEQNITAPMRTLVLRIGDDESGYDDELFCDDCVAHNAEGMRCLDEHIEHIYTSDIEPKRLHFLQKNEYNDFVEHIVKNRYLVCISGKDCEQGEQQVRLGSSFYMKIPICEPTRMLPGTTCKDNVIYCGDEAYPGVGATYYTSELNGWRCIDNHWMCVDSFCECEGKNHSAGKFGTCRGGKAYCGDKEMDARIDQKGNDEGYVCQNGKWLCAKPEGCGKCGQYQTLSDKGKCEGKSVTPNIKYVECKTGNCPCGDGACPKEGACLTVPGKDPVCVCGKYHEQQGCRDRNYFPMFSNDYGEFTCQINHETGSSGGGDYYFDVTCENEAGCHVKGETKIWQSPSSDDDDDMFYDWTLEQLTVSTKYGSNDFKLDAYDKAFQDLEYGQCGRSTATEFEHTCAGQKCEGYTTKDTCEVRTACDTMPVPRAKRKNFSCDHIHGKNGTSRCYSWIEYPWEPVGLRCNADTGCTCNHETCVKGQLCVDGVCHYDTVYAQNTCQNVYPHLAPDETAWSMHDSGGTEDAPGLGTIHVFPPLDSHYDKYGDIVFEPYEEVVSYWLDEYDVHQKVLFWDYYSPSVENKLVTFNGTCLCGYSEVTPKKLSDYKCVQSLGYVCINASGCACGNTTCTKGSLCLREGLCSSIVMDKGLAPEKVGHMENEDEDDEG